MIKCETNPAAGTGLSAVAYLTDTVTGLVLQPKARELDVTNWKHT